MAGGTLTRAQFTARISGTYTSSGTVTNTQCHRVDDEGNSTTYTATGTSSESTTFKATKGALFEVSKTTGERIPSAGGFPIPISASITRTSTLDETTEPKGCNPGGFPLRPNCGTKRKAFQLSVFGRKTGGFSYNFIRRFSSYTPEDPFTCPLAEGGRWWGRFPTSTAKVSYAKLFNRSIKTIVVQAKVTKSPKSSSASQGYTAATTETLSWKVTLTRRG
jgi:hypothetical protein